MAFGIHHEAAQFSFSCGSYHPAFPDAELDSGGEGYVVTFGQLLQFRRMSAQKSMREMARLTGIDSGNWSKYESGERNPPENPDLLMQMIAPLNLTKEQIYEIRYKAFQFHRHKLRDKWGMP